MRQRKRMEMDARRSQLLDLGIRLFSERAYEDVSVDEIAEAAGVSKGLLYHYFGSKQLFHGACVQLGADRLVEAVRPDPALDPDARAVAGLSAYLDFVQDHSLSFLAVMRGGGGDRVRTIVEDARQRIVDAIVSSQPDAGGEELRRLATETLVGAVEAASVSWLRHGTPDRATLEAMLLGVMASLRTRVLA